MASVLLALNAAADNDARRVAVATQAAERMRRIELPLALYGNDEHFFELRVRAAVEVSMNPQFYDVSLPDCALPCRDNECQCCLIIGHCVWRYRVTAHTQIS